MENTLIGIWIVLIVILIICVFVVAMVLKMWRSEWKPSNDFKRIIGIDEDDY